MATVTIQIDPKLSIVIKSLEMLPQSIGLAARSGLVQGMRIVAGRVQRNITDTFETTGKGGLRQSVTSELMPGNELVGRIAVDKVYASVHEFGGIIKKKPGGPMLTVPIAPESRGKRASDFPDLVFIKRRGKPPLLVLELGRQKKVRQIASDLATRRALFGVRAPKTVKAILPLFVLLPQVEIPARPYFIPAIEATKDRIPGAIRQQIDAVLATIAGGSAFAPSSN